MYHITSCVSHCYHCSSDRIHVRKRRTQSSTSYGNLLWPHTLKREKHSRIFSIEPVDQVASSYFNIYNLFQPSANLFPRMYSGFRALGFLCIKSLCTLPGFSPSGSICSREKKITRKTLKKLLTLSTETMCGWVVALFPSCLILTKTLGNLRQCLCLCRNNRYQWLSIPC